MPSSYTGRLRLTLQATGSNLATWGTIGNAGGWQLMDDALAGQVQLTLNGSALLTSVNGGTDQARRAVINITGGSGGVITIPAVEKPYTVLNGAAGSATISCGGTGSVTVQAGSTAQVYCDGMNVLPAGTTTFGGYRLRSVGFPTDTADAATKGYVDSVAFGTAPGTLPGQTGADYQFLSTVGGAAQWANPLPEQSGNAGLVLKTNGTSRTGASWSVVGNVVTVTASTTYNVPAPRPPRIDFYMEAPDGGGGGGARCASGGAFAAGGGGAGGGETLRVTLFGDQVPPAGTTITITVGAAGVGGAGATVDNTSGADGTAGGNLVITCAGYFAYTAFGGSAGRGGTTSAGTPGYGGNGGGHSLAATGAAGLSQQAGSAPIFVDGIPGSSEYAGAAGGGAASGSIGSGYTGGASAFGRCGGGGGGTFKSAGNSAPGGGGSVNSTSVGGLGGTAAATGVAGGAGAAGVRAGGGGGAGASNANAGAGGNGDAGKLRIWTGN